MNLIATTVVLFGFVSPLLHVQEKVVFLPVLAIIQILSLSFILYSNDKKLSLKNVSRRLFIIYVFCILAMINAIFYSQNKAKGIFVVYFNVLVILLCIYDKKIVQRVIFLLVWGLIFSSWTLLSKGSFLEYSGLYKCHYLYLWAFALGLQYYYIADVDHKRSETLKFIFVIFVNIFLVLKSVPQVNYYISLTLSILFCALKNFRWYKLVIGLLCLWILWATFKNNDFLKAKLERKIYTTSCHKIPKHHFDFWEDNNIYKEEIIPFYFNNQTDIRKKQIVFAFGAALNNFWKPQGFGTYKLSHNFLVSYFFEIGAFPFLILMLFLVGVFFEIRISAFKVFVLMVYCSVFFTTSHYQTLAILALFILPKNNNGCSV